MLSDKRLQEAKEIRDNLKIRLRYNHNIYMIRYYNRFITRLNKMIGAQNEIQI